MSKAKKTRSDSILGNLPEDRKAEIAEYAREHSVTDTRAWLAADGIRISAGAFSEWLHSYKLSQRFAHSENRAEQFRDWLSKEMPKLSAEELDARAALMFQFEAVETGDAETYLAFATARHKAKVDQARLKQKDQALAQTDRRLKLLEAKAAQADQAKGILQNKELSEEEKRLKMHALFGLR